MKKKMIPAIPPWKWARLIATSEPERIEEIVLAMFGYLTQELLQAIAILKPDNDRYLNDIIWEHRNKYVDICNQVDRRMGRKNLMNRDGFVYFWTQFKESYIGELTVETIVDIFEKSERPVPPQDIDSEESL